MDEPLGNLAPLDSKAYDEIVGQLAGRELPRYVALFVVTSQAVAVHTGNRIDTVIGKEVAPLVKHLTACMDDRSGGRRAIVIDRDQHKAWCVGFSAAASLVIAAADQHRHSPG